MANKKIQQGRLFIAPISFFLKNLVDEISDDFRKNVFQKHHMVCGYIARRHYVGDDWFLVTLKSREYSYDSPSIMVSYDADLKNIHIVKEFTNVDYLQLMNIENKEIARIIKDKAYD